MTAIGTEALMQDFKVDGMTCGHCVRAVTDAVHSVDPGAVVEVDLKTGHVTVQNGTAPARSIMDAIAAEGYTAAPAAA